MVAGGTGSAWSGAERPVGSRAMSGPPGCTVVGPDPAEWELGIAPDVLEVVRNRSSFRGRRTACVTSPMSSR